MFLNCHSYYSLCYGMISEQDLVEMARRFGIGELALTDINNTSGCLNFIRTASAEGIKPLVGVDFRNGHKQLYIAIAKNNEGFEEINNFLSSYLHQQIPFPNNAPLFEHSWIIYPFKQAIELPDRVWFAHERIGISVQDLRRLPFSKLKNEKDRLVVLQPITFKDPSDFEIHHLLRAIDQNSLLSKLPEELLASPDEVMCEPETLIKEFSDFSYILENTQEILSSSHIHFDFSHNRSPQNQRTYGNSQKEDEELVRHLCKQGMTYRYGEASQPVMQRMEMELEVIIQMGFLSYFLINWDIVSYAKSKGYFHVGRGSGANSIVAYLLGITDVDPVELDLYFERFINLYRTSPPDFDLDFSWKDREDVTRYIFSRFAHVALLGTYVTFQFKGAVRELGKVFGLPKEDIDLLSSGSFIPERLDELSKGILNYAKRLDGLPHHLSIHAGGILISQKPIHYFSATFLPPKGFPTTQFDMVVAEDVGLYKFDILGQRGLAKIKDALSIIARNQPDNPVIDIHDVKHFKQDKHVNELISTAQCMGCFYVESPAMRMLLYKLRVNDYLGLVAASSIIRPGVAKSGMMREYILRHRDPDRRKQAHTVLERIMPDTYGIMVYQEDVIKVAHHFAGLSLGEADVLRRGMSGKFRSRDEFMQVEQKFVENCRKRGYNEQLIQEIWYQISSFAGYAFAKGHSASYAVESYQTLYLKAYFPLEYLTATLNNGGGFYRQEFYAHEARMLGALISPPCVNRSIVEHRIDGKEIYLGLGMIKGMEQDSLEKLIKERDRNGPFQSFEDFLDRVVLGLEQLSLLIRIDAFRFTNQDRHALLWKAHFALEKKPLKRNDLTLFRSEHKAFQLPKLYSTSLEMAFEQWELLGFPLCSPYSLLQEPPKNQKGVKDLRHYHTHHIDIYGYLVAVKHTSTNSGKEMRFATFLDQQGKVFDVVLFPPVAARYPFRGRGVYRIYGKVVSEFDYLSIETVKMLRQDYIPDPRYAEETKKPDKSSTINWSLIAESNQ